MSTEISTSPDEHAGQAQPPLFPRSVGIALRLGGMAPYRLLGTPLARHLVERNLLLWRGQWPALVAGVFEPLLYLLVLGVGVGGLIPADAVPADSYGQFIAAGLLGAAAMNATVYETYNVFFKLSSEGLYEAVGATPAGPRDMATGEVLWAVSRAGTYAIGFLAVAWALGLLGSPLALLALPISLLIGFAFASTTLVATTHMRSWNDFDLLQVVIVPMFLFSATFYPLEVLPGWARVVTQLSPLYHGVAALRQVMTGTVGVSLVVHLGVLAAMGALGLRAGTRRFSRLLRP